MPIKLSRFLGCLSVVFVLLAVQYFASKYWMGRGMDEFSHELVVNSLVRERAQGDADIGGFMLAFEKQIHIATVYAIAPEFSSRPEVGYTSLFGLQYSVGKLFAGIMGSPSKGVLALESFYILLTSVLLAGLFISVETEFGSLPAWMMLATFCLSTVFTRFSGHIYWVPFLLIAPFCLLWCFYPALKHSGTFTVGIVVYVCLLLKSLCGYEFVTTVLLSTAAPILYYELRDLSTWKGRMWPVACKLLLPLCSGVLGILTAMALHVYKAASYFGSLERGFAAVLFPASYSSGAGSSMARGLRHPVSFRDAARVIYFQVTSTQYFLLSIAGALLAFALLYWFGLELRNGSGKLLSPWRPSLLSDREQALAASVFAATVASLSWWIMIKHSIAHQHITWILYVSIMLPSLGLFAGFVYQEGRRLRNLGGSGDDLRGT